MKVSKLKGLINFPLRSTHTATATKKSTPCNLVTFSESRDGMRFACSPHPDSWKGLTRILTIFDAGSRYESLPKYQGISHLLRRACGISTDTYTAVNLTRHIQQMGAELRCKTTREHLIYSIDVAPNLASRATYLMAHMATHTAFYDWELKDQTYKLMRKDTDILNRRQLGALAVELVHEAAFGLHPDGSGLGHSLYAASDCIGAFTVEDIDSYMQAHFTPMKTAFVVVGNGDVIEGNQLFESMCDAARLHPDTAESKPARKHGFIGGEVRRNLTNSIQTYACLAWPTRGKTNIDATLALALCSRALQAPASSVLYAAPDSLIVPPVDATNAMPMAMAHPLFHVYADLGLFGVLVTGCSGRAVGETLVYARDKLDKLANTGLTEQQFERARQRLKSDLLMRAENQTELAEDLAVQILSGDNVADYRSPHDICAAVDKLQPAAVNKVLASTLSSPKAALAVVGADTLLTPPLAALVTM